MYMSWLSRSSFRSCRRDQRGFACARTASDLGGCRHLFERVLKVRQVGVMGRAVITKTNLVSITFRQLAPADIVSLVAQAQLDGIEWGGDVHVPHGDVARTRTVRQLTHDAGLHVLAYGSYFRLREGEAFEPVLEIAVVLGVRLIRVWAGDRGSALADATARERINLESRRISEWAAREGIRVAYEFHGNTLTNMLESTLHLLEAAPLTQTLWQPPHELTETAQLEGLRAWIADLDV